MKHDARHVRPSAIRNSSRAIVQMSSRSARHWPDTFNANLDKQSTVSCFGLNGSQVSNQPAGRDNGHWSPIPDWILIELYLLTAPRWRQVSVTVPTTLATVTPSCDALVNITSVARRVFVVGRPQWYSDGVEARFYKHHHRQRCDSVYIASQRGVCAPRSRLAVRSSKSKQSGIRCRCSLTSVRWICRARCPGRSNELFTIQTSPH